MLRGFRHKLLLMLHVGVLASAAVALTLWPSAWPAVLVCVGGTLATANWLGRLARRYLNASLGRLRRVADDISAGRPVAITPLRPERDLYRLNAAINTLAQRLAEAARQQERLQDELRRRERLAFLGELAATVAHEVNNPLDGVQNCARILRRSLAASDGRGPADGDRARVGQMLDLIDAGLARIELIVRRLLTLARENAIRPQPVRLSRVLEAALAATRPRLESHGVRVRFESLTDADETLADGPLLEQVFVNLMLNAADSMAGGGTLTLTLRREDPSGHAPAQLCVDVADTGAGIPANVLPHIFEPFFTTKRDGKGTGLGLAIAARIVDAHSGTIAVAPRPGGGTVFTVRLPAAERKGAAGDGAASPPPAGTAEAARPPAPSAAGPGAASASPVAGGLPAAGPGGDAPRTV